MTSLSDSDLIPTFVPPLAVSLANAEKMKGRPLSREEVERVRDNAPCIMLASTQAAEMAAQLGYRDINPENVWADWHRLRVQMTGNGFLPSQAPVLPAIMLLMKLRF